MKTIAKKNYMNPQMNIVLIQNQQPLLTGSNTNVGVLDRVDNGTDIGDEWDTNP